MSRRPLPAGAKHETRRFRRALLRGGFVGWEKSGVWCKMNAMIWPGYIFEKWRRSSDD